MACVGIAPPELGNLRGGAVFDQPVKDIMRRQKLLKAPPETLVAKAAKLMAGKNVGAIAVVAEERLVGIFTERDLVFRVVARGLDVNATTIAEVMTPQPKSIAPGAPFGAALLVMHEGGFRHLPVVDSGKVVGIVSARSAMDPDLEEFVSEVKRREHYREKT
jgi:CBS domain-containing protein